MASAKFVSPMAVFLFSVFLLFTVVANLPASHAAPDRLVAARAKMRVEKARKEARLAAPGDVALTATGASRAAVDAQIGDAGDDLRALAIPQLDSGSAAGGAPLKVDTGWRRPDSAIAHASANPALTLYKLKSCGYKYSWTLIPISLPFLWLLFAFRRDVGLYDHAILRSTRCRSGRWPSSC